jgi:hypothetical protein
MLHCPAHLTVNNLQHATLADSRAASDARAFMQISDDCYILYNL